MVYDSDFYTTRRPYRTSPSLSTYTSSTVPSRQVRVLPGLGKVHIVHTYDRIVPYVGHKRLAVVSVPPRVYSTRPSVLHKEYDWIENKLRPWVGYSATNRYLNSDSAVRISYVNYPIGDYSYYYTLNSRYPRLSTYYRWYYNWPRTYSLHSYWPTTSSDYYLWPTRSWPYYRSLLGSYFRNYYLSSQPSLYYRSLDYNFAELENKIDNLSKMVCTTYPIRGIDYSYYPETTKYYRPLTLYYNYYWPMRTLSYYSDVWPYYPYYRYLYYKYTLPSDRYYYLKGIFDDETRLIRAQTASLLRRIHDPVPRANRYSWPLSTVTRYDDSLPARFSSDSYIQRTLVTSPGSRKVQYTTYYSEPVRKYIGKGNLASVSYAGETAYGRRRPAYYIYDDPLKSDIQLLSYYITKFRQEKAIAPAESTKVPLNPARPTRRFGPNTPENEKQAKELNELRAARAARQAFIQQEEKDKTRASKDVDEAVKAKKAEEEARLAAEKAAAAEEQARQQAQAKKEEEAKREAEERKAEAARKAELARQEELAAQAAAERAAELEKQAELARQREAELQAEIERKKKEEEERARLEEQKRIEDEARAEEERKQLERLEELARQAEEEKEAELKRQADELAELARQEAELAEQAKREAEAEEAARQQAESEELERQQKELEELGQKEKELEEQAKQESEAAAKAQEEAEAARLAAEEEELAELERQQAELDRLEAEAKAIETDAVEEEQAPAEPEPAEPAEPVEDEEERKFRELDEMMRQKQELAELERAQAELDALEAEAKALACDFGDSPGKDAPLDDDDEPQAIAEDLPGEQSDAGEEE